MQVVTACAVLHNICVGVGDELPVEDGAMEGDDPPLEEECGTEPQSGAPWRAALANAITPLEVAPQDLKISLLSTACDRTKTYISTYILLVFFNHFCPL